jgi:hypothetical protein
MCLAHRESNEPGRDNMLLSLTRWAHLSCTSPSPIFSPNLCQIQRRGREQEAVRDLVDIRAGQDGEVALVCWWFVVERRRISDPAEPPRRAARQGCCAAARPGPAPPPYNTSEVHSLCRCSAMPCSSHIQHVYPLAVSPDGPLLLFWSVRWGVREQRRSPEGGSAGPRRTPEAECAGDAQVTGGRVPNLQLEPPGMPHGKCR